MIGYFDGASRGNPGEAGAGALLMDDNGNTLWETARLIVYASGRRRPRLFMVCFAERSLTF